MRKRNDAPSRPLWHDLALAVAPPLASAIGEIAKEWAASKRAKTDNKSGT